MRKKQSWYYTYDNLVIPLPKTRGHGQTVMGAISTHKDRFFYQVLRSTSNEEFRKFASFLVRQLPDRGHYQRKPILVMDNHAAHVNSRNLAILRTGFNVLF